MLKKSWIYFHRWFCPSDIANPFENTPKKGTKRKIGHPSTPFFEATHKAKKKKLDKPYKLTKETCHNLQVPFDIGLGYLGARYFHNVDPKLEALFKWLFAHISAFSIFFIFILCPPQVKCQLLIITFFMQLIYDVLQKCHKLNSYNFK